MNKDSQHGGTACYINETGAKSVAGGDGVTGATTTALPHHALRFQSLYNLGRGFAFPCDSAGNIDFSQLSEKARVNYNFAMNEVGHSLAIPFVQETDWQPLVR